MNWPAMRATALALLMSPTLAAAPPGAGSASAAEPAPRLVAVVTAAEPQSQLMGMVLTMQAMMQGAAAHLLLCGPAGDLALKDAPASATAPQPPKGMSPQGLMRKIIEKGGKVEVCAIYLPGKGLEADALLDGVTVASPPDMAAAIMDRDARVLSF